VLADSARPVAGQMQNAHCQVPLVTDTTPA